MSEKISGIKNAIKNLEVYIRVGKGQMAVCKLKLKEVVEIEDAAGVVDIVVDDKVIFRQLNSIVIKTPDENDDIIIKTEHEPKQPEDYDNFEALENQPEHPLIYGASGFAMIIEKVKTATRKYKKVRFLMSKNYEINAATQGQSDDHVNAEQIGTA